MGLIAIGWAYREREKSNDVQAGGKLPLTSPVSLKKVLTFAGRFLGIQILGTLAQRLFGSSGLQVVSVLGGFVSSASTTAAAANLVLHGKILASEGGTATVLASIASLLINLPIVQKQIRERDVLRDLYITSLIQAVAGILVLFLQAKILHLL